MVKLECTAVGRGSLLDWRILAEAACMSMGETGEEISSLGGPDHLTSSISSNRQPVDQVSCLIAFIVTGLASVYPSGCTLCEEEDYALSCSHWVTRAWCRALSSAVTQCWALNCCRPG